MDIISAYFVGLSVFSAFIFYLLNNKIRGLFLTILSCGFIASLSFNLLAYVVIYAAINYYIGLNLPGSRNKKAFYRFGIFINLLQIVILKYAEFTLNPIFSSLHIGFEFQVISKYIIPVGVSYFTLQAIGYLFNVKMGWEKPEKNFPDFLLYLTFYPKFLSGPIERSKHFLPQVKTLGGFVNGDMIAGLKLVLLGFFKKLVIANHLAPYVHHVYADVHDVGTGNVWLLIIVQPLYLYFDFSGYTDIAIGLARMYGIDLLPNFKRPFMAENMTNFWKRFHITLSSWFNDYIFKQVSFRRRKWGIYASVYAMFLTWILFGIWHGAGWNFMFLGFVLAISILYEFFTKKQRKDLFSKFPPALARWIGRGCTFIFYGWALTFFFSPDFLTTVSLFNKLALWHGLGSISVPLVPLLFGLFVAAAFLFFEVIKEDYSLKFDKVFCFWQKYKWVRIGIYYIVFVLVISKLSGNSSFVYEMF